MGRGLGYVLTAAIGLAFAGGAAAQTQPQQTPPTQVQAQQPPTAQTPEHLVITPSQPGTEAEVIDRIIAREHQEVATLRHFNPIVETYIQDMRPDAQLGSVPDKDHYYLGEAELSKGVVDRSMLPYDSGGWKHKLNPIKDIGNLLGNSYVPSGFLQMIFVDPVYFDKQHYRFDYVRNEFLGSVKCLVFDVTPLPKSGDGRFQGRVWVENQDYSIVRFNGVFVPVARTFGWNLHFDSWRTNVTPNLWVPSYVYSAESDLKDFPFGHVRYRSQTRLWGYDLKLGNKETEFSDLQIEAAKPIQDQADASKDVSPVMAEREWQREGEDNVIERLQRNGLLAPPGPVDKVLCTVVNNLEVTNNLDIEPEIRCRVLLTSTLEAFTIGHTIVVSRGLLDVLPDEPSLAAVLAHELGAVVTGSQLPDAYSFNDTTMVSTADTMKRMSFRNTQGDEEIAAKKAVELLKNSPYKNQLGTAGLFLKQVAAEQKQLPSLISANLGNRVFMASQLVQAAPALQPMKVDQIAALPLGSRIVLDSWDDTVDLVKTKPVQLLSAREKMPFEVTPFMPYLTRYQNSSDATAATPTKPDLAKQNPQTQQNPR
ncbi:MAG TPA: M48 family metalloprotease [Candidatus Acidoferrales bacterium]|nr:M48 family metalloprotease [Candidatus Acidoferrales bacterium]